MNTVSRECRGKCEENHRKDLRMNLRISYRKLEIVYQILLFSEKPILLYMASGHRYLHTERLLPDIIRMPELKCNGVIPLLIRQIKYKAAAQVRV